MPDHQQDSKPSFNQEDIKRFGYCLDLAEAALKAGDQPFGSILVDSDGKIIAEARNRINGKNVLAHPEIELAEWAVNNLGAEDRQRTRMYTTGEHCPMCAGAHGWAQIGALYYLSSAEQLAEWLNEFGVDSGSVHFVPAGNIIKNAIIKGPAKGALVKEIKEKHRRYYQYGGGASDEKTGS